jgi:hypothetical protein
VTVLHINQYKLMLLSLFFTSTKLVLLLPGHVLPCLHKLKVSVSAASTPGKCLGRVGSYSVIHSSWHSALYSGRSSVISSLRRTIMKVDSSKTNPSKFPVTKDLKFQVNKGRKHR